MSYDDEMIMRWQYSVYEDLDAVLYFRRIEAIVSPGGGPGWDWLVRPTSSRSYEPEVFSAGATLNRASAIEAAEAAVVAADKHYPSNVYSEPDGAVIYHFTWRS